MGKLNRPRLARGAGTLVFQFMSFMMQMLELKYKIAKVHGGKKAQALGVMMFSIVAMAGIRGIPFEEDLEKMFEWMYKKYNKTDIDIESEFRQFIAEQTNPLIADLIVSGAPSALMNIDMSGRLGFGNILPNNKDDTLGIWYDMLITRPLRMVDSLSRSNFKQAFADVAPAVLKNPTESHIWATDGVRTRKGQMVLEKEALDKWDIGLKALGFTSGDVSRERTKAYSETRANIAVNDLQSSYYGRIAKLRAKIYRLGNTEQDLIMRDQHIDQIKAVYGEIVDHNAINPPHKMIDLKPYTIKQRTLQEILGNDAKKPRSKARLKVEEIRKSFGKDEN